MRVSMLFMDERVNKMDQIMVISTFSSDVIQDFNFYFCTRIVSLDCPDDLDSIITVVSQILALESSSKCAITKVTHNFVIANLISDFVLKMASILIFAALLSLRAFDVFTLMNRGL